MHMMSCHIFNIFISYGNLCAEYIVNGMLCALVINELLRYITLLHHSSYAAFVTLISFYNVTFQAQLFVSVPAYC